MKKPIIVDGHEYLAYNAVFIGLDPSLAAEDKRQPLSPDAAPQRGGIPMVGIPNLLKGNVRVIFATLYANPATNLHAPPGHTYSTPAEAEAQGRDQLHYYLNLAQGDPRGVIIRSRAGLERVIAAEPPPVGVFVLMEGAC